MTPEDNKLLDDMGEWLAWFAEQPGAGKTDDWLQAFKRLRAENTRMLDMLRRRLLQLGHVR